MEGAGLCPITGTAQSSSLKKEQSFFSSISGGQLKYIMIKPCLPLASSSAFFTGHSWLMIYFISVFCFQLPYFWFLAFHFAVPNAMWIRSQSCAQVCDRAISSCCTLCGPRGPPAPQAPCTAAPHWCSVSLGFRVLPKTFFKTFFWEM